MHPLLVTRGTANHITHLTSKVSARSATLSLSRPPAAIVPLSFVLESQGYSWDPRLPFCTNRNS